MYVIHSESKGNYSHENPIKLLTSSLESNLCDYSDAYILVTRTIAAAAGGNPQRKQLLAAATQVIFKKFTPFKDCTTEINDTFVDYADFIYITMPIYN